ncbi:MAG: type II/IV secretion system protein [Dehalococcoidaceae bacterium]|nr:type II/IV secretion system protein [Dehalococcoidaceae bacterium]
MSSDKTKQDIAVASLADKITRYFQARGFDVSRDASLRGKSAVRHSFDLLAQRDDGFTQQVTAVLVLSNGKSEKAEEYIFDFANKAFDTGIKYRMIVTEDKLPEEVNEAALKQRIKIIQGTDLDSLINDVVPPKARSAPLRFETRQQLLSSLDEMGYRIEKEAKLRGRSGVEYGFDILAYGDGAGMGHTLGIDILSGGREVSLNTISLFDTKAYDVGLDDKIIALEGASLTPAARQFAEHQGIKIIELRSARLDEPAPAASEKPYEGTNKPPAAETQKTLRHGVQPEAIQLIPEVLARRYSAVPVAVKGKTLEVAMADPTDILALEAFGIQSKMRIKPVQAPAKEVREAIDFNYKAYGEIEHQISTIQYGGGKAEEKLDLDSITDAPLARALNLIIDEAVKARASDIHIEPQEQRLRTRYRIDGTLHDVMTLPLDIHSALISRIKIMSNLNIADHFRAQDGQFNTKTTGRDIDVRVAVSPTVYGEMAVLRLLDKTTATLEMSELGMLPETLEKYNKLLKVPYGMILISGPTGAGKTTTLYASVNSLDKMSRKIITVEDPAEYRFDDINQIQVNNQAGITFASGLRSILRLDPDVILVGEIRDAETANIAVQAALTGHLMLSSIHANDTIGVLFRLIDLGVEPYLLSSAMIGVAAQRMVRRICPDCVQVVEAPLVEQLAYEKEIGVPRKTFPYGAGCKTCAYTGYRGRTVIMELLTMSDNIRRMLIKGANTADLREQAIKEGMVPMIRDGMLKVQSEITTPSEVLRSAFTAEHM